MPHRPPRLTRLTGLLLEPRRWRPLSCQRLSWYSGRDLDELTHRGRDPD